MVLVPARVQQYSHDTFWLCTTSAVNSQSSLTCQHSFSGSFTCAVSNMSSLVSQHRVCLESMLSSNSGAESAAVHSSHPSFSLYPSPQIQQKKKREKEPPAVMLSPCFCKALEQEWKKLQIWLAA